MELGLSGGEGSGRLGLGPLPDIGAIEEADSSGRRSPGLLAPGEVRIYEDLQSLVSVSLCPLVVLVDEPRLACQASANSLEFPAASSDQGLRTRGRDLVEKQMSARSWLK